MRASPFVLAAALAAASAVSAQPKLRGESPARGPEVPAGVIAGDPEATATVLSAANLGYLASWNAMAMYTWLDGGALRGPSGGGLYFASPLPLIDRIAVGGAVELLRPGQGFAYADSAKLSLAVAVRLVPMLSLGGTYSHVFLGEQGAVDTLDLSAALRLGRWAALSLVAHDVPAPQFLGVSLQRVYQPELALRPIGNYRLEIAVGARVGERRGDVDPTARIQFVPTPGLTVRGSIEYARDVDGDGVADNAIRGTVGLQLDFTVLGFAGYALAGTRSNGTYGGSAQGGAFTVRLSGDRYPALWRPRRFERIDIAGKATSTRGLPRLLDHLRRIAADERTDGVIVVLGDVDGSWATMEELRGAFRALRTAGKRVVVYAAELSMKSYYAASAAERILLDPAGGVRFVGVHTQAFYLRGVLDMLGARADFVKIAEYKSAPELLTRTGASDEAKAVRAAILDDIDERVLAAIAADRKLDAAKVAALRDAGPYTARGALTAGLVDELKGGEEVESALSLLSGGRRVDVVAPDRRASHPRSFSVPAIAVIHVDGDIVEGRSRNIPILERRVAGHESILAAIERARNDDRVKAIVVRIDSGGGNALASDLIARELTRTRAWKPIICSFGDTAASGGYFIAAGCDTIVAEPSTITGSIGIFTGKVDLSGLADKLGVAVEIDKRGARADMESWFRPYTDDERALILDRLTYYYDRFIDTVAKGRGMRREQVEAVARGRVWTGAQALDHKLIEKSGGFLDALALAQARGGPSLDAEIQIIQLPEEPSTLLGQIAQWLGVSSAAPPSLLDLPEALRALVRSVPPSLLLGPSQPQARMEYDFN